MAHRSPSQLRLRRRIEAVIGTVAPVLDVVLFAGDRLSRVAGRNDIEPEPPRRLAAGSRGRLAARSGAPGTTRD